MLRLTIVANLLAKHELVQRNHLRVGDQVAKVLVHEATAVLRHDPGLQRPAQRAIVLPGPTRQMRAGPARHLMQPRPLLCQPGPPKTRGSRDLELVSINVYVARTGDSSGPPASELSMALWKMRESLPLPPSSASWQPPSAAPFSLALSGSHVGGLSPTRCHCSGACQSSAQHLRTLRLWREAAAAVLFRRLADTAVADEIGRCTYASTFVVEPLDAFDRGGEISQRRLREHRLEHLTARFSRQSEALDPALTTL